MDLETLEWHLQVVAMLDDKTGKGHSQVVAKPFLADFGCKSCCLVVVDQRSVDAVQEIAGVEYLEKQTVAFVAVFAHEGRQILHCGSFDLPEPV